MAIPTIKLSTDSTLETYADNTNSILEIRSMLFETHIVKFLAFLTSMDQSFDSTWNTEEVFGRNDPIAIFQGTRRTISLAFSVVAGNLSEAKLNLKKIDVLTSFLYPSYKKVTGKASEGLGSIYAASYMNGAPLVKVKFANLVNSNVSGHKDGLMGYIESLSVSPVLDAGTFIDNIGMPFLEKKHYPKTYELSFSLNVLHQQTPGWSTDGDWLGEEHFFGTSKNRNTPTNTGTSDQPPDPIPELDQESERNTPDDFFPGESLDIETDLGAEAAGLDPLASVIRDNNITLFGD